MHTRSLAILATLLVACGGAPPATPTSESPATPAAEAPAKAPEAEAPAKTPADDRVLADSGLGVGGKFRAFQILNCESGDEYCQVCRYGGSPKIMAVGTLGDPEFKNDLQNIDALVKKYGEDKVKAFAVIADIHDGKGSTPQEGRDELVAQAKAMRTELGISIPVVVPALEEGGVNKAFDDYYNITQSRTLMFADGRNAIRYSAVAPTDLSGLHTAITEVIGGDAAG
ncbi:MAG: hypothetical protein R3B09_28725 [Nannocystaceae bacterium]